MNNMLVKALIAFGQMFLISGPTALLVSKQLGVSISLHYIFWLSLYLGGFGFVLSCMSYLFNRTDGVLEITDTDDGRLTYKLVLDDLDTIDKKTYFVLKVKKMEGGRL